MSAMTRDEVLKLAMDADAFIEYTGDDVIDALTFTPDQLESFARAVAERERAECASLCSNRAGDKSRSYDERFSAADCAAAIRARGGK